MTSPADDWTVEPDTDGEVELFCFPPAGNGASTFRLWITALAPRVRVVRVQPPGRETRFTEPFCRSLDEYLDRVTVSVGRRLGERPFAFLGHSMGAIVAFETARRLEARMARRPVHFFASAFRDPSAAHPSPIFGLPDEAFIDALQHRYGAMPEAVRHHPEILDAVLPILRSDLALLHEYVPGNAYRLDCPLTAIGGASDPWVGESELAGWKSATAGEFALRRFAGDHFFVRQPVESLMELIRASLLSVSQRD